MGKREMSVSYAVEYIVAKVNDKVLLISERRALLDALGHGDCVPRGWCDGYVNDAKARAERAERERDALRADNDRLRGLLEEFDRFASIHPAYHGSDLAQRVADALSADAEPCDCEPIRYPLHLSNSWTYTWEHQPDCATQRKES